MESVWVAQLHISARTAAKLAALHQLDAETVRLHVECVAGLTGAWHEHEHRGSRMILEVQIAGRRILVVLYPRSGFFGDEWDLGSAYQV